MPDMWNSFSQIWLSNQNPLITTQIGQKVDKMAYSNHLVNICMSEYGNILYVRLPNKYLWNSSYLLLIFWLLSKTSGPFLYENGYSQSLQNRGPIGCLKILKRKPTTLFHRLKYLLNRSLRCLFWCRGAMNKNNWDINCDVIWKRL